MFICDRWRCPAGCGLILIVAWLSGCVSVPPPDRAVPLSVVQARTAVDDIEVDGRLDEPFWKNKAIRYDLALSKDKRDDRLKVGDRGEVYVGWDRENLYIAARLDDADIVAEGRADQDPHGELGDALTIFLKPADKSWFWEFTATPARLKSSAWTPGRGRLGLASAGNYHSGLAVAAQMQGTLNKWEDRDDRWTVEMAIPVQDLTALGEAFGVESDWRILIVRHNYSRYLPNKEITIWPVLPETSFYQYEEWAGLQFRQ